MAEVKAGYHHQRQPGVRPRHQDQADRHHQRGSGPDPKGDMHEGLDRVHVACEAGQQFRGLQAVQVPEEKGLDFLEQRGGQIAGRPFVGPDRKGIVPQSENGSEPGDGEHQGRGLENDPLVLAEDLLVDDPLD